MSKALICPCEDVTVGDIRHAISKGYCDVESVKRFTGFGTGICQGKSCQAAVAAMLANEGPLKPQAIQPFTPRQDNNWVEAAEQPDDPVIYPIGCLGRIEECEPHLMEQIRLIQPKVICTLGNFATKLLSGQPTGITRCCLAPRAAKEAKARLPCRR